MENEVETKEATEAKETKKLENMTAKELMKEGVKKGAVETAKKPWFRWIIVVLLAFCIGFGLGYYQQHKANPKPSPSGEPSVTVPTPTKEPSILTIRHVEGILSPASDLITSKYNYTDADTYEDYKQFFNVKLPFTTYKVVFTYSGECGVGFDLSKVSTYVDNDTKTITITLPELEIKYNEIDADSFEYYNVSTTIFNQLKMEDTTDLIGTLLSEKEKEVLNDKKVMEDAQSNAELVIKSLLENSDLTKDYQIVFK